MLTGKKRSRGFWLGGGIVLLTLASTATAQISISSSQRAQDGTVYQVITAVGNLGGADALRVTTVAGSVNGTASCSNSGASSGQASSAIGGVDPSVPQILHPFDEIVRTGLIVDASNLDFTAIGSGRLTLGSGANQVEICRVPNLCSGGAPDAPIFALSSAMGGIPAACVAQGLTGGCVGAGMRDAIGFGLPAMGSPPVCTSSPTISTTVCGPAPTDGVTLLPGQALVLIYNHSLGMQGISLAAGGFGIDTDGTDSASCDPTNVVVTADAVNISSPALPPIPGVRAPAASHLVLAITGLLLALAGARRVMRRH